jgi:hypothetical protein
MQRRQSNDQGARYNASTNKWHRWQNSSTLVVLFEFETARNRTALDPCYFIEHASPIKSDKSLQNFAKPEGAT